MCVCVGVCARVCGCGCGCVFAQVTVLQASVEDKTSLITRLRAEAQAGERNHAMRTAMVSEGRERRKRLIERGREGAVRISWVSGFIE